jgi:hypothetical protein
LKLSVNAEPQGKPVIPLTSSDAEPVFWIVNVSVAL